MKGYSVFNAEQIDGLPEHYRAIPTLIAENSKERIDVADRFFANLGADIRHGGNRAFYHPGGDFIQMPPFEAFVSTVYLPQGLVPIKLRAFVDFAVPRLRGVLR